MPWWVLTFLDNSRAWTSLFTQAQTNRADHLFMSWSHHKPSRTRIYRTVRGAIIFCGYKYTWNTPNVVEQNQSGDTIDHTFSPISLQPTDHVWYYLWSIAGPYGQPCQGPLIHIPPPEVPMPSARIFHSVDQPAPSPGTTILTFDSVLWDDGDFYDPANPTRLTAPVPGLYLAGANAAIEIFAADKLWMEIMKNGPPGIVHHSHWCETTGWAGGTISLQTLVRLNTGDFLQTRLFHQGPGGDSITAMPDYSPHFWITYIGPYPT